MFARLRNSTIAKAVSSNLYIQLVQTIAQFALVPVLASHWGLKTYGTWILLSTVPSYLAMADLGLASAAGNDMVAQVARGDRVMAAKIYHAVRLTVLSVIAVLLTVTAGILWIFPHLFAGSNDILHGRAHLVIMLMVGYGGTTLINGVIGAGYRAIGGYAVSGYIGGTLLLTEVVLVLTVVMQGGGILAAAVTYLAVRVIGTAIFSIDLWRRAPWLVGWHLRPSWHTVRRLLRPAFAVMVVPAAQAVSIQGTVAVIGIVGGAAAIPAFTAVRTLSRVIIQAVLIVNHAIMPSFTMAHAVDDRQSMRRYTALSLATSIGFGLPGMLGLIAIGQFFVVHWTVGKVHPDFTLILVMAMTTMVAALWLPVSNLILSINRHESFTYHYLAITLIAVALGYPLVGWLGTTGAALSLLLIDMAMLFHIVLVSRRIGIVDWHDVVGMVKTLPTRWRMRPGRKSV